MTDYDKAFHSKIMGMFYLPDVNAPGYGSYKSGYEQAAINAALAAAPTPCPDPKPYDYSPRRMENRNISALYEIVSRQSAEIHALTEQVQALKSELEGVDMNLAQHRHRPNGETVFAFEDEYPSIGPSGIDWEVIGANIDAAVEATPDQPDADDADKWQAVGRFAEHRYRKCDWEPWSNFAAQVVFKAQELGLIPPRIDPTDPEQLRVVADAITECNREVQSIPNTAKRILTALAKMNGGGE
jgi:hypothetical protein